MTEHPDSSQTNKRSHDVLQVWECEYVEVQAEEHCSYGGVATWMRRLILFSGPHVKVPPNSWQSRWSASFSHVFDG